MQSVHASVVGPNAQIKPPPDEVVTPPVVEEAIVLTVVTAPVVTAPVVAGPLFADVDAPLFAEPLVADDPTLVEGAPPVPLSSSRTRTREPHAAATIAASAKAIVSLISDAC
jgi:hypothetical protein